MLLKTIHYVMKGSLLMLTRTERQYLYYYTESVGSLLFT